jgi:GNAT superfamily N-acetyltransferase
MCEACERFGPPKEKQADTVPAYKIFRTLQSQPGALYPLFINKTNPVPQGEWVDAENIPTPGFAPRPGWHAGDLPSAPHLRSKKEDRIMPGRVWAEVELPADVDWQPAADESPTGDIRDAVPEGGHYRKERPKNQGGEWLIGGGMRVNKQLSDDEVSAILEAAGDPESAEKERREPKQAAEGIFQPGSDEERAQVGEAFGRTFPASSSLYVATDPEAIGGMAGFAEVNEGGSPDEYNQGVFDEASVPLDAYLQGLFVREGSRGKGYGSQLLTYLREKYPQLGVATDNSGKDTDEAALHLYGKHGLEPFKREEASTYWKAAEERPTIVAVDLDGTLAEESEDFDPEVIGKPRTGAAKWVQEFVDAGAKIIVHTCRDADELVKEWADEHDIHVDYVNENPWQPPGTSDKLFADIYVDNRGLRATGPWSKVGPQVLRILKAASTLPELYDTIDSNINVNVEKLAETPYWQRGVLSQLQRPAYDPQAGLLSNLWTNATQARQKAEDQIRDREATMDLLSATQPGFALRRFQRYIHGGDFVKDPVDQMLFRSTV